MVHAKNLERSRHRRPLEPWVRSQSALSSELADLIAKGWDDCALGRAAGERNAPGALVRKAIDGVPLTVSEQVRLSRVCHLIATGRMVKSRRLRMYGYGQGVGAVDTVELKPAQAKVVRRMRATGIGGRISIVMSTEYER